MIQIVIRHFLRGLLIVVPIALTAYVVFAVFSAIDGWLDLEAVFDRRLVPGAGFILTFALVTLIGFLGRIIGLRWLLHRVDDLFARLPLVKLLYTSIRDLTSAVVGERRRFDRPVAIQPMPGSELLLLGFLTRDSAEEIGLPGFSSVYLPQSYNFAGQVALIPQDRVQPLSLESARAMKFIVSAGVAGEDASAQA